MLGSPVQTAVTQFAETQQIPPDSCAPITNYLSGCGDAVSKAKTVANRQNTWTLAHSACKHFPGYFSPPAKDMLINSKDGRSTFEFPLCNDF